MGNDRSRKKGRSRKVDTRDEHKTTSTRELLTFSFKNLDQTQPKHETETLELWQENNLFPKLMTRLKELSMLTRDEASKQHQISIYGNFPASDITDFSHPTYIDPHVSWGVIKALGGLPRIAGYLSENTFYIVFLDSKHRFWKTEKRNT